MSAAGEKITAAPAAPVQWTARQQQRVLLAWSLRSSSVAFTAQGFMVYYLLELKANDRLLGWATALPSLLVASQLLGSLWAEQTRSRARLCFWLYFSEALCLVPVLVVGLWAAGNLERYSVARIALIVSLSGMALTANLYSPAWESLFCDAVPDEQKSVFFGKWGLWAGIGSAGCTVLGGWLIDTVSRGRSSIVSQKMFLLVFACCLVVMLGTARLYRQLMDVPVQGERYALWDLIRQALAQRNFSLLVFIHAVRLMAVALYAPFVIAWFRESLGMGILFLSLVTALYQGVVAVASPFWSRMVQRFGGKPVLIFGLIASMSQMVTYFVYTPDNYRWLSVVHWGILGFLISAYDVAVNTLWYAMPQPQARTMQFAMAYTVTGITCAIGATLGGWGASHASDLVIGPYRWSHYHWLLPLAMAAHLPCFLFLRKLEEPGAHEPWVMVRWMLRRVRLRRPPG